MMSEHVTVKQVLVSATGALKGQKPEGLFLVEQTVKILISQTINNIHIT